MTNTQIILVTVLIVLIVLFILFRERQVASNQRITRIIEQRPVVYQPIIVRPNPPTPPPSNGNGNGNGG